MIVQKRMYLCGCDLKESRENAGSIYECECGERFFDKTSNRCPECGRKCTSMCDDGCPDCLGPYEEVDAFQCNFCHEWIEDWQELGDHLYDEHMQELVDFYLDRQKEMTC